MTPTSLRPSDSSTRPRVASATGSPGSAASAASHSWRRGMKQGEGRRCPARAPPAAIHALPTLSALRASPSRSQTSARLAARRAPGPSRARSAAARSPTAKAAARGEGEPPLAAADAIAGEGGPTGVARAAIYCHSHRRGARCRPKPPARTPRLSPSLRGRASDGGRVDCAAPRPWRAPAPPRAAPAARQRRARARAALPGWTRESGSGGRGRESGVPLRPNARGAPTPAPSLAAAPAAPAGGGRAATAFGSGG